MMETTFPETKWNINIS